MVIKLHEHLPAGDYILGRTHVGNNRHSHLQDITLRPGEQKTLDLVYDDQDSGLPGDGHLVVLVVDEQGHPIATPDVWMEQNGQIIDPIFNTDDGKSFAGSVGSAKLYVEYTGYQTACETVLLKSSEDNNTQEILRPHVVVLKKQ